MKRCPECGREYDNTMMFCLDHGASLLYGPASREALRHSLDEPATAILPVPPAIAGNLRQEINHGDESKTAILCSLIANWQFQIDRGTAVFKYEYGSGVFKTMPSIQPRLLRRQFRIFPDDPHFRSLVWRLNLPERI
jgi:hypothetical protein